ncbi:MAG: YraN family protein [Zoogloeaceae bacterium]|jgi:putative endonuclease|nr:YraN family protein [Zoogloeaceae bacterium]
MSVKNWLAGLWEKAKRARRDSESTDGMRAETLAANYLRAQGLVIVARNFRVRGGEIDLIAREGEITVFVEVRLRRSQAFGGAIGSIGLQKRRRLLLAAQHWLLRHPRQGNCRFDCVLLDDLDAHNLEWIRHAFTADA